MGLIGIVKGTALSLAVKFVRSHKEYGPVFDNLVARLRGKAVFTGAFVTALPLVAANVRDALVLNGVPLRDAEKYTDFDELLALATLAHKVVLWADEQAVPK